MAATVIGPYTVGEVHAPLTVQFLDASGSPVNLTGYTAKFVWAKKGGTPTEANATITDTANGIVTVPWTAAVWQASGPYELEVWVGNGAFRLASELFEFEVRKAVAVSTPNI